MTKPATPPKSLTLGMSGFDGLVQALGRLPRDVKSALALIDRGQLARGSDALTTALIKVELAKATILGNLAFAAMKEGDVGKVTGYIDIALESLTELGLETTEIGVMFALVHANLPADKPDDTTPAAAPATPAEGETSGS